MGGEIDGWIDGWMVVAAHGIERHIEGQGLEHEMNTRHDVEREKNDDRVEGRNVQHLSFAIDNTTIHRLSLLLLERLLEHLVRGRPRVKIHVCVHDMILSCSVTDVMYVWGCVCVKKERGRSLIVF